MFGKNTKSLVNIQGDQCYLRYALTYLQAKMPFLQLAHLSGIPPISKPRGWAAWHMGLNSMSQFKKGAGFRILHFFAAPEPNS